MTEVVHALIKDVKEMEDVAKRLADQLRKDAAAAQALADAENNAAAAGGSGAASFMSGMTKEQTASRMTYSVKCQSERTVMPYNGKDPDAEDDGTRLQSKNVTSRNLLEHQSTKFGVPVEAGGLGTVVQFR
jgi:hypothetical protein